MSRRLLLLDGAVAVVSIDQWRQQVRDRQEDLPPVSWSQQSASASLVSLSVLFFSLVAHACACAAGAHLEPQGSDRGRTRRRALSWRLLQSRAHGSAQEVRLSLCSYELVQSLTSICCCCSDESPFGSFFHPFQRCVAHSLSSSRLHLSLTCVLLSHSEDEFDAQMSPFDFLRQEMLRPFEGATLVVVSGAIETRLT